MPPRSNRVLSLQCGLQYDYNVDPCGAVHITIGDAGNSEGLSFLTSNKTAPGKHPSRGPCWGGGVPSTPACIYPFASQVVLQETCVSHVVLQMMSCLMDARQPALVCLTSCLTRHLCVACHATDAQLVQCMCQCA